MNVFGDDGVEVVLGEILADPTSWARQTPPKDVTPAVPPGHAVGTHFPACKTMPCAQLKHIVVDELAQLAHPLAQA